MVDINRRRARIVRVIEYEGPEDWVDMVIGQSLSGTYRFPVGGTITAALVPPPRFGLVSAILDGVRGAEPSWPAGPTLARRHDRRAPEATDVKGEPAAAVPEAPPGGSGPGPDRGTIK